MNRNYDIMHDNGVSQNQGTKTYVNSSVSIWELFKSKWSIDSTPKPQKCLNKTFLI